MMWLLKYKFSIILFSSKKSKLKFNYCTNENGLMDIDNWCDTTKKNFYWIEISPIQNQTEEIFQLNKQDYWNLKRKTGII